MCDGDIDRFDWRDYQGNNLMTPVKNVGNCGSTYAFAVTSVIESKLNIQEYLAGRSLPDIHLSEQELMCASFNNGCGGGSPSGSLGYVKDFGIVENECLPYNPSDNLVCTFCDPNTVRYTISDFTRLDNPTDDQIYAALRTNGPIIVYFQTYSDLYSYQDGIYTTNGQNYAGAKSMILVGYDLTGEEPYWILQNDWDTNWGEQGFLKIAPNDISINRAYFYFIGNVALFEATPQ
ncbi:MAG: C1 family peptidase [Desulfobacterales bacterium]